MAWKPEEMLGDELDFLLHNVFLLPQLRLGEVGNPALMQDTLLQMVYRSLEAYRTTMSEGRVIVGRAVKMVKNMRSLRQKEKGALSGPKMKTAIQGMADEDVLAVEVTCQNAGLIIKRKKDQLHFESFEASPRATRVITTNGALLCQFPGPVVSVPFAIARQDSFLHELTSFLEQLDREPLELAVPQIGQGFVKIKDSAHPRMITEMLTGILRTVGEPVDDVQYITKRIRDESMGAENQSPWRRSPLWLVVRVALQALLGKQEYKSFLLYFMSEVTLLADVKKIDFDNFRAFVDDRSTAAVEKVRSTVSSKWRKAQEEMKPATRWNPDGLKFEDDTILSLELSSGYLDSIMEEKLHVPRRQEFEPHHPRRDRPLDREIPLRKCAQTSPGPERYTALADLESWVEKSLDKWMQRNTEVEESISTLGKLMNDYIMTAKEAYLVGSEDNSIMLLTALEMWVVLDKLTVQHFPLLKDYAPNLKVSLWHPLLLPKASHINRLQLAEQYVRQRIAKAKNDCPSVFSDPCNEKSFAVRSFRDSEKHRKLLEEIQKDDKESKQDKRKECDRLNQEYNKIQDEAKTLTCTGSYNRRGTLSHPGGKRKCRKCTLLDNYNLRIEVYETLLPRDSLAQQAIVFELKPPRGFTAWREASYCFQILLCTPQDILKSKEQTTQHGRLLDLDRLAEYRDDHEGLHYRITMSCRHRSSPLKGRIKHIPCSHKDVVVENIARYELFDKTIKKWSSTLINQTDLKLYCHTNLPKGPYKNLEYAVNDTVHVSNEIIANQGDCPAAISLHEYYAFGVLRSGARLNWPNILRELRQRTLSLNNDSVYLLIRTAAWQVGPPNPEGDNVRECHQDLASADFGNALLDEISSIWTTIESNWLEDISARLLITLTCQLLSRNSDPGVVERGYGLLKRARKITLGWTRRLVEALQKTTREGDLKALQKRTFRMAACCKGTYDVEEQHLGVVFDADISPFVECAIIMHDNESHTVVPEVDAILCIAHEHSTRVSHALESRLRECLLSDRSPLDESIARIWTVYTPGEEWKVLSSNNERWMVTETKAADGQLSLNVQFNLLDGTLLIDGLPLGRLSTEYSKHSTFVRIFGEKILDVNPSDMPGMVFQSRNEIEGNHVYFSMRGEDLVIRSKIDDHTYELIPHEKFFGDLADPFVKDYTHWLDVSTGEVELRPMESLWKSNENNWRITSGGARVSRKRHEAWVSPVPAGPRFKGEFDHDAEPNLQDIPMRDLDDEIQESRRIVSRLQRGSLRVLDIRSPSAKMVHGVLQNLEELHYLILTFDVDKDKLAIGMPRFKLDFFNNKDDDLECRQFRGMVVDRNQNPKAWIGLKNMLVLKPVDSYSGPTVINSSADRKIIVPQGNVRPHKIGNKATISVTINPGEADRVKYYIYDVDSKLGRLVGDGSLASHLYKIYLHALTSFCKEDPLTGRTGTEEALSELRSAATWSFQKLDHQEIELLRQIAALSPPRSYHPKKEKFAQMEQWSEVLTPLAQHDELYDIVDCVFQQEQDLQIFREGEQIKVKYPKIGNVQLHQRAAIRVAIFRGPGFGAEKLADTEDAIYKCRHFDEPELEGKVFAMASMAFNWKVSLTKRCDLLKIATEWKFLGGLSPDALILGYSAHWIDSTLQVDFITLYETLRKYRRNGKFSLMFWVATLVYGEALPLSLIQTLIAFATLDAFQDEELNPPTYADYYHFDMGFQPSSEDVRKEVLKGQKPLSECPESYMSRRHGEDPEAFSDRRQEIWQDKLEAQADNLTEFYMQQYPTQIPRLPDDEDRNRYNRLYLHVINPKVKEVFASPWRNVRLRRFLRSLQEILDTAMDNNNNDAVNLKSFSYPRPNDDPAPRQYKEFPHVSLTIKELLRAEHPNLPEQPSLTGSTHTRRRRQTSTWAEDKALRSLIGDLAKTNAYGFVRYANDLQESLRALLNQPRSTSGGNILPMDKLESSRQNLQDYCKSIFTAIEKRLHREARAYWGGDLLIKCGLTPRITTSSLLQLLASNQRGQLSPQWKVVLITYGKAICYLQRSERLLEAAMQKAEQEYIKEAENNGFEGWNPADNPDWLMLQLECNIMIRKVQTEIAAEMIAPYSGKSSLTQLNLGEGKSSVIVPMVATSLAKHKGDMLVRVFVLKPLAKQMFSLLVQRLGSLMNRRIYYLPFSRSANITKEKAVLIFNLYKECMETGGILLVQPEHILSFKLMGLERLCLGQDPGVADSLIETQHWLDNVSRDLMDESDELLGVKYSLIYTLGAQRSVEFAPDRWLVIQQLFDLIQKHAPAVCEQYPRGIELQTIPFPGSFPSTRVLEEEAGKALLEKVAMDVCNSELTNISFRLFPEGLRSMVFRFITEQEISEDECGPLLEHCRTNASTFSNLLLLRGLMGGKILAHILGEKRWRVDYGLDLSRSMLAVPFRAKDSPTLRSEFSHADVSLSLTCLAYYYGGLNAEQVKRCFGILKKEDNPNVTYEAWAARCTDVPEALRTLNGVNLQDSQQFEEVYPLFSHNKSVVDFYLSRVVFVSEAKEFPHKLPSSGWDLAGEKTHVSTGFSGSNDGKYVLPISIAQRDLPEQSSTNAKVLGYLLQPENENYICARKEDSAERLTVAELFNLIVQQRPEIKVVIDVGAQVLELKNREVAELWLSLVPSDEVMAAVYFNEQDEVTVLLRDGHTELLQVSSFAKRLDQCVVYLDEAHTRGTDLKLAPNARAAVMLGPSLTKDRLTQACMRMRKLGVTQSVSFFAPPEIDTKIRNLAKKAPREAVEVKDILHWTINETCMSTKNSIPLWASQGMSYLNRRKAWDEYWSHKETQQLTARILEPEAQSLEQLYGLHTEAHDPLAALNVAEHPGMDEIKRRCNAFGVTSLHHVRATEEQEREIEMEAEREYQIERPPKLEASKHEVQAEILQFVEHGTVPDNAKHIHNAWESLAVTSARYHYDVGWRQSPLLMTDDFASTVELDAKNSNNDDYIRPVNWLLTSQVGGEQRILIVSPNEANEILPLVRRSKNVRLHLYAAKVTKSSRTFEDLAFYSASGARGPWKLLPDSRLLIHQLNLFAGQLYIRDMQAYEELCGYLGICTKDIVDDDLISHLQSDGFVGPDSRVLLGMPDHCPFTVSPVMLLKNLLSMRRKRQDYWGSHMGQILNGRYLREIDFLDAPTQQQSQLVPVTGNAGKRKGGSGAPTPSKRARGGTGE